MLRDSSSPGKHTFTVKVSLYLTNLDTVTGRLRRKAVRAVEAGGGEHRFVRPRGQACRPHTDPRARAPSGCRAQRPTSRPGPGTGERYLTLDLRRARTFIPDIPRTPENRRRISTRSKPCPAERRLPRLTARRANVPQGRPASGISAVSAEEGWAVAQRRWPPSRRLDLSVEPADRHGSRSMPRGPLPAWVSALRRNLSQANLGGRQSGRYSRSPVAGLYHTRIGLPDAGSVKTSSVG
jgi:hypothetical protein